MVKDRTNNAQSVVHSSTGMEQSTPVNADEHSHGLPYGPVLRCSATTSADDAFCWSRGHEKSEQSSPCQPAWQMHSPLLQLHLPFPEQSAGQLAAGTASGHVAVASGHVML